MNIRVQQLNPTIGDIAGNTAAILSALEGAEAAEIDLLILTEMAVCGYPSLDLLERNDFYQAIEQANQQIIAATGSTALIFGTVTLNTAGKGRPCFNAALMAHQGRQLAEVHKSLLPTYDVFDELRYFEPNDSFQPVLFKGAMLGLTICEDIWSNQCGMQYHTYRVNPLKELVNKEADCIINISASPFTTQKSEERRLMMKQNAQQFNVPIFYANQVGANTELLFDGDSLVVGQDGEVVVAAPLFERSYIDTSWRPEKSPVSLQKTPINSLPNKAERTFKALCCGLHDYVAKTQAASKVLIGLSGGIDSALVACIAVAALGADNVAAITMPSKFSTKAGLTDAGQLAKNLGIELHHLPIKLLYDEYNSVLEPLFADTSFGVAEENIQARIRGILLMAVANKFGQFVLNTGNKSELAVGYCTLYGDMNGALAVIADLYKTEVYEIAHWLNQSYYQKETIPSSILEKAPSAELRPDQKDSDSLPEYDKLDTILQLYIEQQKSAADIQAQGFDKQLVAKIIALVDQNEHKRYQAAPALKVHKKAFGMGRRWPLAQKWTHNALDG